MRESFKATIPRVMEELEKMAEGELTNHVVPATEADNQRLQIRADVLPERAMTVQRVTDPLPPALIERVGQLVLDDQQKAILMEPVPDDEIDIRFDSFIYVSHEYCRRKLFEAFGPLGWNMVEASPLLKYPGTDEWYQKWALLIGGVFAGVSMSGMRLIEKNPNQDLGDVYEKIQSDCLRRICGKTLGIGIEAWNKRRQKQWRDKHAIPVLTQDYRGDKKVQWRREDADPFIDGRSGKSIEIMAPYVEAPEIPNTPPKPPAAPSKTPPAPPVAPSVKPEPQAPLAAKPAGPVAAPKSAVGSALKILPVQARAIENRLTEAGLVDGENAQPAREWLSNEAGLEIIIDDTKSSVNNMRAMIAEIPGNQVSAIARKLEAMAKEKKG